MIYLMPIMFNIRFLFAKRVECHFNEYIKLNGVNVSFNAILNTESYQPMHFVSKNI